MRMACYVMHLLSFNSFYISLFGNNWTNLYLSVQLSPIRKRSTSALSKGNSSILIVLAPLLRDHLLHFQKKIFLLIFRSVQSLVSPKEKLVDSNTLGLHRFTIISYTYERRKSLLIHALHPVMGVSGGICLGGQAISFPIIFLSVCVKQI